MKLARRNGRICIGALQKYKSQGKKRIRNRQKSGHQFDNAPCRIETTIRDTALQLHSSAEERVHFLVQPVKRPYPTAAKTQKLTNLQQ